MPKCLKFWEKNSRTLTGTYKKLILGRENLSECLKFCGKEFKGSRAIRGHLGKTVLVERKIVRMFKILGKKFKGSRRH